MKRPRLGLAALFAAACLAAAPPAAAQGGGVPPAPDRWVTDRAGFLSAPAASTLDARLEAFEKETGRQVLVYIDRTTGAVPLEDFAVRAFEAWKVGRKGLDDGVVLFVMAEDRKIRIEVGYGLEATVTDLRAGRIIRDVIVPRLQAGDNDGAVTEGAGALIGAIRGESGPAGAEDREPASRGGKRLSGFEKLFGAIAVIFFIILFITNPRLAMFLLWTLMSGGRGGGSGGGGGGFRGGGGRSGGGGASGSW